MNAHGLRISDYGLHAFSKDYHIGSSSVAEGQDGNATAPCASESPAGATTPYFVPYKVCVLCVDVCEREGAGEQENTCQCACLRVKWASVRSTA